MKKLIGQIPRAWLPVLLFVLMACVFVYAITLRINASSMGGNLGFNTGFLAGRAVGSFEGMTTGLTEGTAAGREAGLSAADSEAEIASRIQQMANLEVLVASVKLSNFHTIGNEENPNYAALYLAKGTVIFTVDLSHAEISAQLDGLHIVLPKPVGKLNIDNSTVEKAAEYQKKFFNGSAEDGFDAYLNSMAKTQAASEETLDNYSELFSAAREAAVNQVTLLVKSVSAGYKNVIIDWAE